jgi:putative hydrolase of HD superfamily
MRKLIGLAGRLAFIEEAERLKSVLRSAHTRTGRQESTAEHSWRLCLLAMTLQDVLGTAGL